MLALRQFQKQQKAAHEIPKEFIFNH